MNPFNLKLSKFQNSLSCLLGLTSFFHTPIVTPKPTKHSIISHRNITSSLIYIFLTEVLFFTIASSFNFSYVFLPHLALTFASLLIFTFLPTRENSTLNLRLIRYQKKPKSLQHQPNYLSPYLSIKVRSTLLGLLYAFYITLFLASPIPANAQSQPNPGTYRFKFVNSGLSTDSTPSSTTSKLILSDEQLNLKAILPFSFTISEIYRLWPSYPQYICHPNQHSICLCR